MKPAVAARPVGRNAATTDDENAWDDCINDVTYTTGAANTKQAKWDKKNFWKT